MKKAAVFILLVCTACLVFLQTEAGELFPGFGRRGELKASEPGDLAVPPALEAQGAILIDQDSGEILFSKNSNLKLAPADTTQIVTALLALKFCDLEETVTVGNEIQLVPPSASKARLYVGEVITVRDLLRALMLPSGNDAAYTIAVHVGRKTSGSQTLSPEEALSVFTGLMNQEARELGTAGTFFTNPGGFHQENHLTTAADMALLARKAMENSCFRQVVQTVSHPRYGSDSGEHTASTWENTNKLIKPDSQYYYAGATGIKAGDNTAAGYCLVASASRRGQNLIAVVLGSTRTGVFSDAAKLLDYGFYSPSLP